MMDLFGYLPSDEPLSLSAVLQRGDLDAALVLLNGMSRQAVMEALLRAGFSVTGHGRQEMIAYAQHQLIAAAQAKTDGFGVRHHFGIADLFESATP
jgi:hypothetical protein